MARAKPAAATADQSAHLAITLQLIRAVLQDKDRVVIVNGHELSIPLLIRSTINSPASADVELTSDQHIRDGLNASLQFMLARTNKSTYGVTTGFGAAATTRTHLVEALQVSIVEHLLAGVTGFSPSQLPQLTSLPRKLSEPLGPSVMPESIVRGAILVRLNSLSRGHSAVRIELLEGLVQLLKHSITPVVPLRGSISASGDLCPLAYIAGTLCGHPDVMVIDRSLEPPQIISSAECLKAHGMEPLVLGAKEGLAIANGTAFSAAAGAMALYDAHRFALLAQVLTAMMAEAMIGQIGAFHPFIHQTARPHPGQIEVAKTIHMLLETSKLIDPTDHLVEKELEEERSKQILRQDRYPLRTAPQWLGPQLEDLVVAHHTVTCELNSTTDNPLIDVENGILHHGGNFQATSVATSMEKTRLAVAAIGKLMFAQMSEINNSLMNKGLPSCLNGHEPSTNYHTKGLDTLSAGYCAELQYLASPVTTHVQSAEGHNQSVNSLAFISARKTLEAIDILKLLMASHLYCLCQALDLRVLENKFKESLSKVFLETATAHFGVALPENTLKSLAESVADGFVARWEMNASLDSGERVPDALAASLLPIVRAFDQAGQPIAPGQVEKFVKGASEGCLTVLRELRAEGLGSGTAEALGGTKLIYEWVRDKVGVKARRGDVAEGKAGPTIGGQVGKLVEGFEVGGGLDQVLIDMLGGNVK